MPSKRRRRGEGSIRYRKDRQVWEIQITTGYDLVTNRQIRITKTARSEEEAIKIKNQIVSQITSGTFVEPSKITIEDLVTTWYYTFQAHGHYETTRRVVTGLIKNHISPVFGKELVQKTSLLQLQKKFNLLQTPGSVKHRNFQLELSSRDKTLSLSVLKKIRRLLISAFDFAVEERIITKNLARKIKIASNRTRPQTTFFEAEEIIAFLSGTTNRRYYLAYQLLFQTGLRRSELLGLTWDSIDFENNQLRVSKALTSFGNFMELRNSPKTDASFRYIPIHPDLMGVLRLHQEKQIKELAAKSSCENKLNLIFIQQNGNPVNPSDFTKGFKDAVNSIGLRPKLGVHSARRSFATMLLSSGIPISDVMSLGGWANSSTVLEYYAKSQTQQRSRAPEIMMELTSPKKEVTSSANKVTSPRVPSDFTTVKQE